MPIQKRPSGSGNDDFSSDDQNLTPLQRYLAKQKAAEAQQAVGTESNTEKKSFFSELGTKASEARSKVESKLAEKLADAKSSLEKPEKSSSDSSASPGDVPPSDPPPETPLARPSTGGREPGPFFARFVAYMIDVVILVAVARGFDRIFFGPLRWLGGPDIYGLEDSLYFVVYHTFAFFYFGWFYSQKGASPGKIILQLEVKDAHSNARFGYWRAFLRESIGKYISAVPFLLGFFLAGLRRDHRSLHDLVFDTQVVRKHTDP